MSNPTGTILDTDAARRGVSTLLATADGEAVANLKRLAARIQSLEDGRPWGGDDPGKAFQQRYTTAPDSRAVAIDLTNRLKELAEHLDGGLRRTISDDEFTRELLTSVPVADVPDLRF